MSRYLDPKNDLTFKKVFGRHKGLCISLLNAMLPLGRGRRVERIEYRTGEQFARFDGGRNTIVDVRCEDNEGRQFIVEMQMYWRATFLQRVLLNASKAYVSQFEAAPWKEEGGGKRNRDPYRLLRPVYALSFVNEVFAPDTAEYYHDYAMVNVADTERRIEGLELVFVELPKFEPKSRAVRRLRDLWLLYMTGIRRGDETVPAALLRHADTRAAVGILEAHSYTREELEAYDKYLDSVCVQDALLEGREERGLARGRAEGLAEGRAEGLAEGRAEGLAEASRDTARKMKALGFSAQDIAKITGLTPEV